MGLLVIVALKIQPKPITNFIVVLGQNSEVYNGPHDVCPRINNVYIYFFNYRDLFEIKDRGK